MWCRDFHEAAHDCRFRVCHFCFARAICCADTLQEATDQVADFHFASQDLVTQFCVCVFIWRSSRARSFQFENFSSINAQGHEIFFFQFMDISRVQLHTFFLAISCFSPFTNFTSDILFLCMLIFRQDSSLAACFVCRHHISVLQ